MKRIIFLDVKNGIFDASTRKIDGYEIEQVDLYSKNVPGSLAKILKRLGGGICYFSFGDWKKQKNTYDYAVFPDALLTKPVLKYFSKHPVAQRQIVYYWNMIRPQDEPLLNLAKKCGFTVMTYNREDVDKYGIYYNNQCWDKNYLSKIENSTEIKQDVYFTGYVKDRYKILCDIRDSLNQRGISTRFNMISLNNEPGTTTVSIPYLEYLRDCKQSNAVLDVVMQSNFGLTLRPLEALFMKKKLITNYTGIKDYDFYVPYRKNIFIWGEDAIDEISAFLSSPFEEPAEIFDLDKYDLSEWIKRFCI